MSTRKKTKARVVTTTVYTCGVDWQHELGEAGDCVLYESKRALERQHGCWKSCGIVKLKATLTVEEWVEPQRLYPEDQ